MREQTVKEYRNKYGALPGWCPCGNALSIEEMEFNDGLCDGCFDEALDDEYDDNDDRGHDE